LNFTPSARFAHLIDLLRKGLPFPIDELPSLRAEYRSFIQAFPVQALTQLNLDRYCIGKGKKDNFCWWLERGLQPVLGRYMPGTARAHMLYWKNDGQLYKHRKLRDLNDADALAYTLKIQAAIANASPQQLSWVDDDAQVYKHAALTQRRVTVSDGRKLRLLSAYHPDEVIPISSADHLKHFLLQFGCPAANVPSVSQPIARMLLLKEVYELARKQVPTLTTQGFMRALYSEELGIAPVKAASVPEDDSAETPEPIVDTTETDDDEKAYAVNTILQGPPGTGKTFATITEALRIVDQAFLEKNMDDREALKARFDELSDAKRIRFVTFHQSFSYEDFVEGLRADADAASDHQVRYSVEPGIFRQICEDAVLQPERDKKIGVSATPRIWKISIEGAGKNATRDYCMQHGEARIGWGFVGNMQTADLGSPKYELGSNNRNTLQSFGQEIQPGDVLLCIGSNTQVNAVGVVTGNYRFEQNPPASIRSDYKHILPVNWIARDLKFSILELNGKRRFTLKTVYELDRFTWPELLEALQAADITLAAGEEEAGGVNSPQPYVLIIDEINRGNISRILGELITLIEPSKRIGMVEALHVTLPYSKKRFGVPPNVHIIGTMNTADRSLTGLDIALRRRFAFKDMPPQSELLDTVNIEGVNIGKMLRRMNERIEALLDRDHCMGHTYFLSLRSAQNQHKEGLAGILRQHIIPLLQEYFFDDVERIGWVLNDPNCPQGVEPFIRRSGAANSLDELFGEDVAGKIQDNRWSVNESALKSIDSLRNIIGKSA